MNKIILIGNLTRDPEVSTTNSGIVMCRLGIAVNRAFVNASTGEREVDFINIVAWRGLAENCGKFLKKGSKIAVCGSLQIRNYEDKDHNKRTSAEVVAEDIEFLTPKSGEAGGESTAYANKPKTGRAVDQLEPVDDGDDLPF